MSDKLDKILAMGLTPQDKADKVVRFSQYDRRTALHEAVKLTDTGLADAGDLFRKTNVLPNSTRLITKFQYG